MLKMLPQLWSRNFLPREWTRSITRRCCGRMCSRMVVGGQHRGGAVAQVVAHAAEDEQVGVVVEHPRPQHLVEVTDADEQIAEQVGIEELHHAERLVADQILGRLEDPVAAASVGLHAPGHDLAQGVEVGFVGADEDPGNLLPRVAVEIGPGLNGAEPPAEDGAVVGVDLADLGFVRQCIVGIRPPELRDDTVVLFKVGAALARGIDLPAEHLGNERLVDVVLVEREVIRPLVIEHLQKVRVIGLKVVFHLSVFVIRIVSVFRSGSLR